MSVARPANPYVGPRAFDEGEADRFFGRERERDELFHLLIARRLVLLHSPSGAGKSSLIRAALVPLLRAEGFLVHPVVRVGAAAAAAAANRFVFATLLALDEGRPEDERLPAAELAGLTLGDYFARLPAGGEELLIFDQFEELLTADPANHAAQLDFFAQLGAVLEDPRRWALFALREDYLGALRPLLLPIPTRLAATFRLDLLGPAQAMRAMRLPAQGAGVRFSDAAAAQLADDLRRTTVQRPDGTPEIVLGQTIEPVQLQVVCFRLWERLRPGQATIDLADVAPRARREHLDPATIEVMLKESPHDPTMAIAGYHIQVEAWNAEAGRSPVDWALASYYADRVRAATAAGASESAVRDWVETRLITGDGLRGQVLREPGATAGLSNAAIQALVDAHLVRAEERRGAIWYELAHDRLVAPVREDNRAWREANLLPFQRQARLWEQERRPAGLLLRGETLEQAEVAAADLPLSPLEVAFLETCRAAAAEERRDRRQRERIRLLAVVASVVGVIALALATWAFALNGQARSAEADALRAADTAQTAQADAERSAAQSQTAQARAEQGEREAQASTLAAQALRQTDIGNLATALLLAAAAEQTAQGPAPTGALFTVLRNTSPMVHLLEHSQAALAVAFADNGRTLITGSCADAANRLAKSECGPGVVFFWDVATGQQSREPLTFETTQVTGLAVSPDQSLLAVAVGAGPAQLVDLDSGAVREVPVAANSGVVFSPDGQLLLTAGSLASLWRTDTLAQVAELEGGSSSSGMAFTADGAAVVGVTVAGPLGLWDARTGQLIATQVEQPASSVRSLDVSPDGSRVAVGDEAGGITVLALPSLTTIYTSSHHQDIVWDVRFSPDGTELFSAGNDGRVVRSRAEFGGLIDVIAAREVSALALSSDGRLLATGGFFEAALWEARAPRFPELPAARTFGTIATTLADPAATLIYIEACDQDPVVPHECTPQPHFVTVADGTIVTAAPCGEGGSPVLALQPAGALVACSEAEELALRDRDTGLEQARIPFSGPPYQVGAQFSPDGQTLVIMSLATDQFTATVQLYELAAGRAILAPDVVPGTLAFSPDSATLALLQDEQIALLDVATGSTLRTIALPRNFFVNALAFSADGALLAAGGDGGVQLWRASTGLPVGGPLPLFLAQTAVSAAGDTINALAFSPDGRLLAIGANERGVGLGKVLLWDLAARQLLGPALEIADFSEPQWLAFTADSQLLTGGGIGWYARWDLAAGTWAERACAIASRNMSLAEWQQFLGTDTPYRRVCPAFPAHPSAEAAPQ